MKNKYQFAKPILMAICFIFMLTFFIDFIIYKTVLSFIIMQIFWWTGWLIATKLNINER